jgi:response regulator RpfG family c-di-GMP phosphodiesterase
MMGDPVKPSNDLSTALAALLTSDANPKEFARRLLDLNIAQARTTDPELAEILRACALPRSFDAEIIGVLRNAPEDQAANDRLLNGLLQFSFVQAREDGGYVYHDNTRDLLLTEWRERQHHDQLGQYKHRLVSFYRHRGQNNYAQDHLDAALVDLNRAIELESEFEDIYTLRARIYARLGHYTEALNDLNRWLMLYPDETVALYHSTLLQALQHSNMELARAYDMTLESWARALELRDKEAKDHAQRVSELTVRLARHMGIGEAELAHMRRGALLHDIGKIGIPDSILLKPGPLTEAEWAIMRQHPAFAYDLLKPVVYLGPALDIPYCHHERWDGTGYPRGLKGEQIPLAARIFAVVDIWDVMRSNRPYQKGLPEDRVREYIRNLSGTHFDPEIVEVFLSLDVPVIAESRLALLLVDDDIGIINVLRRILNNEFTVFTANSGLEALEILAREEIAVILADQRMPGMTGVQLLEQARSIRPEALGILISAYSDEAMLEALNLGTVRGFIQKPWDLDVLRARVKEVAQQYYSKAYEYGR